MIIKGFEIVKDQSFCEPVVVFNEFFAGPALEMFTGSVLGVKKSGRIQHPATGILCETTDPSLHRISQHHDHLL